jgi:predicted SprT family Zn-dependent metalloprotease
MESILKVKFNAEIKRLSELFRIDLSDLKLQFVNKKSYLGMARLNQSIVELSLNYCETDKNRDHMLNETITHEICHFVAYRLYNDRGHGKMWKYTMIKAGKEPNRCASEIDSIRTKQTKNKITCKSCGIVYTVTENFLTRLCNGTTHKTVCHCKKSLINNWQYA